MFRKQIPTLNSASSASSSCLSFAATSAKRWTASKRKPFWASAIACWNASSSGPAFGAAVFLGARDGAGARRAAAFFRAEFRLFAGIGIRIELG